jgi:hypothetical protein
MTREATFGGDAIRRQFSELADLLETDLTVYLIGGGALTLDDLKNATKDIDLIVRERSELQRLWRVLTAAGYEPEGELSDEYDELGATFVLQNDLRRFDVFHEQVAGVIRLTQSMVDRSRHLFDEGNLTVRAVSLNDIFLFKAVANREDDVDDMIRIAQTDIDEDVIVEEIHTQLELLGRDEFIGAMKHKLDRLREQGYLFDIHEEINVLHDRVQDGQAVSNAIDSLLEHEYDDDLYRGVPESAIQRRVGDETASSGIEWLEQIGAIERVSDDSFLRTE